MLHIPVDCDNNKNDKNKNKMSLVLKGAKKHNQNGYPPVIRRNYPINGGFGGKIIHK